MARRLGGRGRCLAAAAAGATAERAGSRLSGGAARALPTKVGLVALLLAVPAFGQSGGEPSKVPEGSSGWLGVFFGGIRGEGTLSPRLDVPARIAEVLPASPAFFAGLRPGDVVVRLDGRATSTIAVCIRLLRSKKRGERIVLDVDRGGRELRVKATLGAPPPPPLRPGPPSAKRAGARAGRKGAPPPGMPVAERVELPASELLPNAEVLRGLRSVGCALGVGATVASAAVRSARGPMQRRR